MIRRIVKLTFQKEKVKDFVQLFEESKDKIIKSEGCQAVVLLQHQPEPHVFFTYSFWDSEAHLNAYRHSELFQQTWEKTKAMFADKPEAWTTQKINGVIRNEGV